jgi:multidrug resistance efflux pump
MSDSPSSETTDSTGSTGAEDADAPVRAAVVEAEPPVAPMAGLADALQAWRARMTAAGLSVQAVALHSPEPAWSSPFDGAAAQPALHAAWEALCQRIGPGQPVALAQVVLAAPGAASATAEAGQASPPPGPAPRAVLLGTTVMLPSGQSAVAGALLAAAGAERAVPLVLLSLGWLQLALAATSLTHNQHAARLLGLLGHVGSQANARAAAQEWVNRTAAWARAEAGPVGSPAADFTLVLFTVRQGTPRWWVASDTAWAETASPAVLEATEIAALVLAQARAVEQAPWWACPLLAQGEPVAVLVLRAAAGGAVPAHSPALAVLQTSAGLAEPLLRQWQQADRMLPLQAWDALLRSWRKLRGPGHPAWKVGAAALLLALAVLLGWPVDDRISANAVIEGRTRQVLSAPFDGFIAQVLVRPGEQVAAGQPLLRLDDRELTLDERKTTSERDQAAAKLRQAMAERDASAMALAQAELQQAQAQLAVVQAKLARTQVRAPVAGLVVSGDWAQQVGAPVETGKQLFELATPEGFRVVLHVADRDIARVQPGQHGALRLTGQPQSAFPLTIDRLTATASVQDSLNGFRVEAQWQGDMPRLSPGMQGVGKVVVGRTNLFTLWTRPSLDWLRMKLWAWWW